MASKTKQGFSIIIGRCLCDDVVKYPFYWCEELIEEANKNGITVIDLQKENFTEEKISKLSEQHNPKFIFLMVMVMNILLWDSINLPLLLQIKMTTY